VVWAPGGNAWFRPAGREGLLLLESDCGEVNVQKSGRDESVSRLLQLRRDARSTLPYNLEA